MAEVSSSNSAPLLPPCRVCGEKASGFHYGANTCEACKGFFRRSLQRKEDYKCAADGNCEIEPGKRNACAYCRYQKCLLIGMSKTAIKTGRYTHEKKTKDIEEVKRIQYQEKLKQEGKIVMTSEEKEKELERIIKHITTVHLQQTPHTQEFFEKLPEREAKFLERRALQEKMFGTMKPLPREEYRQIYQTTGIDIDGRREMITHMIPCIEKAIKRFIAFAKALPGFKELPIDDQIALIKGSRCELELVDVAARGLRLNTKIFATPEFVWHNEDCTKYLDTDYFKSILKLAGRIQKLELTDEGRALIKAIIVVSPDRGINLGEQGILEQWHSLYVEALHYLVQRKHKKPAVVMGQIFSILTDLRHLGVEKIQREEQIYMDFDDVYWPPILLEFTMHFDIYGCHPDPNECKQPKSEPSGS